jgi:hypothetical protein
VVSFTLQALYHQGKCPGYPLNRRMGKPRVGLDMAAKELMKNIK